MDMLIPHGALDVFRSGAAVVLLVTMAAILEWAITTEHFMLKVWDYVTAGALILNQLLLLLSEQQ
jgi:hypothetical protein